MTDYADEQANEVEALQSIYPDEFEELCQSPWCFQIRIQAEADGEEAEEEEERYSICLKFKLTATYPDEVPEFSIVESSENLDDAKREEVTQLLTEEAESNVGMVMVFTLVSATQEYLTKQQDDDKRRREEEAKELEEAERRKAEAPVFFGTPVSVESFLEWKKKFQEEKAGTRSVKSETGKKKLSGKELFERDATLSQSDIQLLDFDDDEAAALTESQTAGAGADGGDAADVDVDESLFEDIDGLDLDIDLDD